MARLINADDLIKVFQSVGHSDAWGGEFIRKTIAEFPEVRDPVGRIADALEKIAEVYEIDQEGPTMAQSVAFLVDYCVRKQECWGCIYRTEFDGSINGCRINKPYTFFIIIVLKA